MKLVYLKWSDACSEAGWKHEKETEEWIDRANFVVEQCGWILKETKHHLVLAGRYSEEDGYETQYGQLQKIPKTWILDRKDLTKHI